MGIRGVAKEGWRANTQWGGGGVTCVKEGKRRRTNRRKRGLGDQLLWRRGRRKGREKIKRGREENGERDSTG